VVLGSLERCFPLADFAKEGFGIERGGSPSSR
jgi:hypothetical protein